MATESYVLKSNQKEDESAAVIRQTWNERRSSLREVSTGNTPALRISRQQCSVENCLSRLAALVEGCAMKCDRKRSKFIALVSILETLLLPSQRGYMTFQHAYEIFSGYQEGLPDREHFRDELLNDQHGLPVVIFNNPIDGQRFVVLCGNGLDVAHFLEDIANSNTCVYDSIDKRWNLSAEDVHRVLKSMDTEYDRECARALLSADKSRAEIYELGMKPDAAVKAVKHVTEVANEYDNAKLAATDMLNLRLRERKEKLTKELENIKMVISQKSDSWPKHRIDDLEERRVLTEERLKEVDVV